MSIVAIVPVASLAAANAALEEAGFGPRNFTVPAYAGPGATHAAMHAWDDPALLEALGDIAGVVVSETDDDPITAVKAIMAAQGAKWGDQAPALPTSGNATANTLYKFTDGTMWWCIQTFSRSTYGAHPSTYPALIRQVREPGSRLPWKQPIDQYDAYKLVNPFTGKADECTINGKTYRTKVDNNVWEPGGAQWEEIDANGNVVVPPPANEWPQWVQPTGGHDAYRIGDKVTFEGKRYVSKINANVWSPTGYPAGWEAV